MLSVLSWHRKYVSRFGQPKHTSELEGIIRPPIELNVSVVSLMVSLLFFCVPELFLMSPFYGVIAGSVFLLFALKRYIQGMYVVLYKRYLSKPPQFVINIEEVEKTYSQRSSLYSGLGFKWRSKHAQRYYDLETIQDFNYVIKDHESALGGNLHLHGVGILDEKPFELQLSDRMGHVLIYGQSGVGKSRVLELWLEQNIKAGRAVFLIDPKGDKDLIKRTLLAAYRSGRLSDVKIWHLGFPDQSVRYNPIGSFQRIAEVAGRIASKLPSDGNSQAFAKFAWRFVYVVANALENLGENITISKIKMHVQDLDNLLYDYTLHYLQIDDKEFISRIEKHFKPDAEIPRHLQGKSIRAVKVLQYFDKENIKGDDILESIKNAYSYERTYYDKITASLLPFLEQLTSLGEVTDTDCNTPLPELNIEQSIRNKYIIIFGLDGLSDPEVAHAMGAMFFADLVSTAGKLYKEKETFDDVIVHADEFNDVISDDFMPLSNKSRGAGIILHAYTQTDDDVAVGIKDARKAMIVKGNFNTKCCMRVASVETARFFTEGLSDIKVKYTVSETRLTDSNAKAKSTTAITSDVVKTENIKLVTEASIIAQPKGQMFVSKNGSQIYHTRFPLIKDDLTKEVVNIEHFGLGNVIETVNKGVSSLPLRSLHELS